MTEATCIKCEAKITSLIIGEPKERLVDLGVKMLDHLGKFHAETIEKFKRAQPMINGLLLLNQFDFNDDDITDEHEALREQVCELAMENAPEDDDDDGDEYEDEDEYEPEGEPGVIDLAPVDGKPGEFVAPVPEDPRRAGMPKHEPRRRKKVSL